MGVSSTSPPPPPPPPASPPQKSCVLDIFGNGAAVWSDKRVKSSEMNGIMVYVAQMFPVVLFV